MQDKSSPSLISVIVAVYNEEDYLEECIESIINQSYKNLDIILVDDGSSDLSGNICDAYADKDDRIRVIHKKNGGLVAARKTGILAAKGYYAAHVDGDDWIDTHMYERLVDQIGDADVIVSGVIRNYPSHTVIETNKILDGIYEGEALENDVYRKMIYTGKFYEKGLSMHIYNSLYKTEILIKNQIQVPEEIRICEDAACFYPIILDAKKIVVTSDSYYHYRIRKGSLVDINDRDELWRIKRFYHYMKKRFSEKKYLMTDLNNQLDYLLLNYLMLREIEKLQEENGLFPYKGIKNGDRLVIYGKGRFGKELINYIKENNKYRLVSWVDKSDGIDKIKNLVNLKYDYIIIAVLIWKIAEEISDNLTKVGVLTKKIKKIDLDEIEKGRSKIEDLLS